MKKQIFGCLVRIGMCEINASQAEASDALERFFAGKGIDVPASEDEQLRLLNEHVASMKGNKVAAAVPLLPATATLLSTADAGGDRSNTIMAAVRISSIPEAQKFAFAQELISAKGTDGQSLTVEHALERIQQKAAAATPLAGATVITGGAAERDKFHVEARDAVLQATMAKRPTEIFNYRTGEYEPWKPSAKNYGLARPQTLAQQCLIVAGVPANKVLSLAPIQVAKLCMGADPQQLGLGSLYAVDGAAYNVTGMFSNIMLDAQNVSLRRSFDDARSTFQIWAKKGEDIPDFKDVNRIIAGELGDPRAVPEDGEFEETTLTDGKEKYRLTVWGMIFSRSWQLIVNDRLNAFMEVEGKMGNAMKRKLNRLAYQELKDNALLADGVALFSAATHNNLTTGALTTPKDYTAAWSAMAKKMREQKGLNTTEGGTLNIPPRFVLFPPAIRDPILTAVRSQSVAISTGGNQGTTNIWEGELVPVEESEIGLAGGGTDTNFFLEADTADIDTLEYAFLQGMPAPVIEMETSFNRLAMRSRIYFAFGTKNLDFRGQQMHTGA